MVDFTASYVSLQECNLKKKPTTFQTARTLFVRKPGGPATWRKMKGEFPGSKNQWIFQVPVKGGR